MFGSKLTAGTAMAAVLRPLLTRAMLLANIRADFDDSGRLEDAIEAAGKAVNAPDGFRVEAAIAVGYPGDKSVLPEELRAREVKSGRKPLSEIVHHGPIRG